VAFCAGLLAGGVLISVAFLVIGSVLRAPAPWSLRVALVTLWLVVMVAREFGVLRFGLPENRRLVPETVFRLGRHLGPFQFGVEMGTGVRTYLPTGLPYVLVVAVALLASPIAAVVAGLGFGLGRCLMVIANLGYDAEGGWDRQWLAYHRQIRVLTTIVFVAMLAGSVLIGA
jgi:hypothetical protein